MMSKTFRLFHPQLATTAPHFWWPKIEFYRSEHDAFSLQPPVI
jgi:hypothetical protein